MQKINNITINIKNTITIVGIATPTGVGGIHIVRLSGKNSLKIVKRLIENKKEIESIKPRYVHYCNLKTKNISEKALVIYFKAPNSFTGEDIVEIHCHGNLLISTSIINELIEQGAKMAEPGEFTRRAFLNGKMDLSMAESLLDLINAKSVSALNSAQDGLNGNIFNSVSKQIENLTDITAHLLASIDYPDEDILAFNLNEALNKIKAQTKNLKELKESYKDGVIKKDGVRIAIIGAPNVGKSMIFNSLVGFDRAIITSEAGTTRDTLDASYTYKDILFSIVDTAGIRDTKNQAEKLGIERSKQAVESADILLCVSCPDNDFNIEKIKTNNDNKRLEIFNKCDLLNEEDKKSINKDKLKISAKTKENIDTLKEIIYNDTVSKISTGGAVLNNVRHYNAVLTALESLKRIIDNFTTISVDCILSDLNECLRALGSITGQIASDEIINEIFSKFCVGK